MKIFNATQIDHTVLRSLSADETSWVYNGLDCCVTFEIYERLLEELASAGPDVQYTYECALAKQAPFLEMSLRGLKVDEKARTTTLEHLEKEIAELDRKFQRIMREVFGHELNWASPVQLKTLFYGEMRLPEIKKRNTKGQYMPTVDETALQRLAQNLLARPLCNFILTMRELRKQASFLKTEIDPDGQFRCNINIAGTNTGRSSSSASDFGSGSNLQNVDTRLRYPFIAGPKKVLVNIDLEQADARNVGAIIHDLFFDQHGAAEAGKFLDACESGDLHTRVCSMAWTELPWTGDKKADRAIADGPSGHGFSYRDLAKKLGHGCLTEDHEVLTPQGWVSIAEKPSTILQWEPGKSSWASPSHWEDKEYEGEMQHFVGNSIDALMTHDHRVPYIADQRTARVKEKPAMAGPGAFMPLGEGFVGGARSGYGKLMAAVMSDGEITSGRKTRFHFHKQRKIARIKMLCEEVSVPYVEHPDGRISISYQCPKIAGAWMLELDQKTLLDFLSEYKHWDGHIGKTSVTLTSTNKEHLEWIKTLGRICGIGGAIQAPQISGFGSWTYRLQQNNRKYASGSSVTHTRHKMKVQVYCPTVETGWFYVRRNGKIFVTGNTNYLGTPPTMAKHTHTAVPVIADFQKRYFAGFPLIKAWHAWVIDQIKEFGVLTTPFGRVRHFFGRGDDPSTHRAAVAYAPQSMTGHEMDMGILNLWRNMPEAELMIQVHDSILFQVPWHNYQTHIERALQLLRYEHQLKGGRMFCVPLEAMVGWNWGKVERDKKTGEIKSNPFGIDVWRGEEKRMPPVGERLQDYL